MAGFQKKSNLGTVSVLTVFTVKTQVPPPSLCLPSQAWASAHGVAHFESYYVLRRDIIMNTITEQEDNIDRGFWSMIGKIWSSSWYALDTVESGIKAANVVAKTTERSAEIFGKRMEVQQMVALEQAMSK